MEEQILAIWDCFGANDTIQTSTKREMVVKPEDISTLGNREFYVLDNNTSEIRAGC